MVRPSRFFCFSLTALLATAGAVVVPISSAPVSSVPVSSAPVLAVPALSSQLPQLQGTLAPLDVSPNLTPLRTPTLPAAAPQHTAVMAADPLSDRQWNMQAIHMPEAWGLWQTEKTRVPVTVAVLDTGYVPSPELTGRVVNGYDFVFSIFTHCCKMVLNNL